MGNCVFAGHAKLSQDTTRRHAKKNAPQYKIMTSRHVALACRRAQLRRFWHHDDDDDDGDDGGGDDDDDDFGVTGENDFGVTSEQNLSHKRDIAR